MAKGQVSFLIQKEGLIRKKNELSQFWSGRPLPLKSVKQVRGGGGVRDG